MKISLSIIVLLIRLLAVFIGSFIFWRKLKEDYSSEDIFSITVLVVLAGLIGAALFSVQGALITTALLLTIFSRYKKWDFWQAADALIFPFLFLIFATYSSATFFQDLNNLNWLEPSVAILSIAIMIFIKVMSKRYRSLSWYKSGKVGFLACSSTIAFFSLFLVLELFFQKALYLTMLVDLVIVIIASIMLYKRSERNWLEDRANLFKFFKKNG